MRQLSSHKSNKNQFFFGDMVVLFSQNKEEAGLLFSFNLLSRRNYWETFWFFFSLGNHRSNLLFQQLVLRVCFECICLCLAHSVINILLAFFWLSIIRSWQSNSWPKGDWDARYRPQFFIYLFQLWLLLFALRVSQILILQ